MRAAYSLRRRLLVALLGALALVWIAAAAYTYFDARHEISELLDAHLAQSASLLVAQVGHELEEIDVEHAAQLGERNRRVAFQIWEGGRVPRLRSANAPQARLSPKEEGYSSTRIEGRNWRVFSAWDARHRYLVQVGERENPRREIAASVASSLLAPLLVALPILGIFVWLSVGRALAPLDALGHELGARRPESLGALSLAGAPAEVLPLVASLNALFERVGRMVENERRFTADAAHELRTPLAALKTQAQVALVSVDDAGRRAALDKVIAGCDRAARLVEQLLTLARLETGQVQSPVEACDLVALARDALAGVAPAALERNVEIELVEHGPVRIPAHPDMIAILLRNLIDNAVRYSPTGSAVRVDVGRADSEAQIVVADEGPGIPAEERSKVGQRFYRVLGNDANGSGLGLSIARRIAQIHGARLTLEEGAGGRGLRAAVAFPR